MSLDSGVSHALQLLGQLYPLVLISLIFILVVGFIISAGINIFGRLMTMRKPWVFIELTPPRTANKSHEATSKLFKVLHGLDEVRTRRERLMGYKPSFSLEIVSSRDQGIRYLIRVTERDAPMFERAIASYLPDVRFKRVNDYLTRPVTGKVVRTLGFKQTGYFAYPLQSSVELEDHDPIAYLTGSMTRLQSDELMAVQLVVTPVRVRAAEAIVARLLSNEELLTSLGTRYPNLGTSFFSLVNAALLGLTRILGEVVHGSGRERDQPSINQQRDRDVAMKVKPARSLSVFEQELAHSVHEKLRRPLFRTSLRVLSVTTTSQEGNARLRDMRSSLSSLSLPPYQRLVARRNMLSFFSKGYSLFTFQQRLPALRVSNELILDTSELASIYHFPDVDGVRTDNVIQSLSRTLPAPISLKNNTRLDVLLGRNHHHGTSTDIGLTPEERERHVYIIGGTGNGKTTMLEYAIIQDIKSGKGVAVVDPHGDLAEKLLRYIPEDRIQDVIYFNPSDLSYPVGLNLLEIPEGLTGDELLDARDFITEAVISIMRKVFSDDDSGGHRIEYILRNTVQTALTVPEATLFTVFDLLTDNKYRKQIVRTLNDQKLRNFWVNEFGKAGDFQRVKMSAGVTAKIGRFQFSASAERILSQPKSTINFEEILDGKILICNFAKGLIGEDTSELFGISTLAKLQLAAYRRVKQQRAERTPFYLYVDEFQNFATMSFVQMLSEARKYKVFLTIAEQTTSQQNDPQMIRTILANVGTVVTFRSGNPADEQLLLPLFTPYITEGEIAQLPTYNFYARISAVHAQEPVSGETLLLEDTGSEETAVTVITASRQNYARRHEEMQRIVNDRIGPKKKPNDSAIILRSTQPGDETSP
jgi:hypothetical protein